MACAVLLRWLESIWAPAVQTGHSSHKTALELRGLPCLEGTPASVGCFRSLRSMSQQVSFIVAFASVFGAAEAIRQTQARARRQEHRSRKNNLVIHCTKSSRYSPLLEGKHVILSGDKVRHPSTSFCGRLMGSSPGRQLTPILLSALYRHRNRVRHSFRSSLCGIFPPVPRNSA